MNKKVSGFKACGNYVILKLKKAPPKTTESGIIIPDIAKSKEDTFMAFVFDIGPEAKVSCKIGDRVVFNQFDAKAVRKDKIEYIILQDRNIMAVY